MSPTHAVQFMPSGDAYATGQATHCPLTGWYPALHLSEAKVGRSESHQTPRDVAADVTPDTLAPGNLRGNERQVATSLP